MFSLEGKVAFITGMGSSGQGWANGQAIATLFARQGAIVYGVDLDIDAAERTADLIRAEGGQIQTRACDVTVLEDVHTSIEDCAQQLGRIDVLVNNVGQSEPGGPVELGPEQWREQLSINLDGAYNCCRCVLPGMEDAHAGVIVSVSSVAGLRYVGKDQVGYASAKAALMQMTRTTAVMYAPKGIRLNCVVPGLMDTPLVHRLARKYANNEYESFVEHRNNQVPMKHMGDAWDVAYAALYLASDEARYVTGHSLVVDGGLTCRTP